MSHTEKFIYFAKTDPSNSLDSLETLALKSRGSYQKATPPSKKNNNKALGTDNFM